MDSMYGRSPPNKGKRWVCPNDRQLALRAKLRTGWSVKSQSFESRYADFPYTSSSSGSQNSTQSTSSPFALTDEERASIVQVIKRAEALEMSEQERVGRLVDRLEHMKKNVQTVTTARSSTRNCGSKCSRGCICSCALCGEKFAVLGAGPSLCHDCHKYICQKCGIETSPYVPGTSPGSSTSSTASGSTTPQQQPSGFSRHLRLRSSSNNANKWFLCRICSETREMWKKSGAWFFKGLPKYVLPEKKGRARPAARPAGWSTAGGARSLEPTEQESSSDDDAARRMTRTRSMLSGNCDADAAHSAGASTSAGAPRLGTRCNSSTSVERRLSNENTSGSSQSSSDANIRRSSASSSTATTRSKATPGPSGLQTRRSTIGDERKSDNLTTDNRSVSQVQLRSSSSLSTNNGGNSSSSRRSSGAPVSGASSANSVASVQRDPHQHYERGREPEMRNHNGANHPPRMERKGSIETGHGYGTLEISLRYDPGRKCLQCRILRARGLRGMDINGLSDPFCKVNILPVTETDMRTHQKTKTVHRTRDPEFNELLSFYNTTERDMNSGKALHVLLLQDDRVARDFLGEAKFLLLEIPHYQTRFFNVFLEDHFQVASEELAWGADATNGRGQIHLSLSYSTPRHALLVTVHRANNLLPMDNNGYSDPFVRVSLTKEPLKEKVSGARRFSTISQILKSLDRSTVKKFYKKLMSFRKNGKGQATTVRWKTLNPEWNEEFAFAIPLTDLADLVLLIWVWDKDLGRTNDYLGGLALSCQSRGARLRHWIDTMKFPDEYHRETHNLIAEAMPFP